MLIEIFIKKKRTLYQIGFMKSNQREKRKGKIKVKRKEPLSCTKIANFFAKGKSNSKCESQKIFPGKVLKSLTKEENPEEKIRQEFSFLTFFITLNTAFLVGTKMLLRVITTEQC